MPTTTRCSRAIVRRSSERPAAAPPNWRAGTALVARYMWGFILSLLALISIALFGNAWIVCLVPWASGLEDVCAEVGHFYWDWTVGLLRGQSQPEGFHLTGAHFVMTPLLCLTSLVVLLTAWVVVDGTLKWWEDGSK